MRETNLSDVMILVICISIFSIFVLLVIALRYYNEGKRKANFCNKYNKPLNLLDYEKIKFLNDAVKNYNKCLTTLALLIIPLLLLIAANICYLFNYT